MTQRYIIVLYSKESNVSRSRLSSSFYGRMKARILCNDLYRKRCNYPTIRIRIFFFFFFLFLLFVHCWWLDIEVFIVREKNTKRLLIISHVLGLFQSADFVNQVHVTSAQVVGLKSLSLSICCQFRIVVSEFCSYCLYASGCHRRFRKALHIWERETEREKNSTTINSLSSTLTCESTKNRIYSSSSCLIFKFS